MESPLTTESFPVMIAVVVKDSRDFGFFRRLAFSGDRFDNVQLAIQGDDPQTFTA